MKKVIASQETLIQYLQIAEKAVKDNEKIEELEEANQKIEKLRGELKYARKKVKELEASQNESVIDLGKC